MMTTQTQSFNYTQDVVEIQDTTALLHPVNDENIFPDVLSQDDAIQNSTDSSRGYANHSPVMQEGEDPLPNRGTILPQEYVYIPDFDIATLSLDEICRSDDVYNRELNWLNFNWRVLQEALDDRTPLLERLRFLAITASNLDEFFRKRVGGLKRQQAVGMANLMLSGWTPDMQLSLIARAVYPMVAAQSRCLLESILPKLAAIGLHLLDYSDLTSDQQQYLHTYYMREVYPILTPLAVDPGHPFPLISNLSLNLAVMMREPTTGDICFARVKVPNNRPRWVPLQDSLHFVPLEQVITHNLNSLFEGMEILDAYPFRVTRNADIARNEEEADDLLEMINEELRERRFAPIVRLEVVDTIPANVCDILQEEMGLEQSDVYRIQGPLGLTDLFSLADTNLPHHKYEPWSAVTQPRLVGLNSRAKPGEFFAIIRQGDLLVHHPYISFASSTQQFIESAARDPSVVAIKQTLYRTSDKSPIVDALILAAEQGKQVAVLVEVKARFDEAQNIAWARTLENAGCHVAYGLVGLKTHSKITLIIREEEDGLRAYYHIGTGNYHPKTANLYTDLGLFSCKPDVAADLMHLFNFLTGYNHPKVYQKLLVAPVNMRQHFAELIDIEIANAMAKRPARVILQMNGFDDIALTRKIYEASQAGVKIDLIIRGNCRIRPGLPGISENINIISVIGRFLEHSRIFYFENDGEPRYFFGSADWMSRNLSYRVEAIVPIEDPRQQQYLYHILDVTLNDYRQGWELLPDGRYRQRHPSMATTAEHNSEGTHNLLMQHTRMLGLAR